MFDSVWPLGSTDCWDSCPEILASVSAPLASAALTRVGASTQLNTYPLPGSYARKRRATPVKAGSAHNGPVKLEEVVSRAVEAALGGGAEAVEAFAEDSTTREVRVFGGEVESLTDAGVRGAGIRAWIGGQVGYAYGTDLSDEGLRRLGADAAEAARIADPDQFAAPPEANGAGPAPDIPGLADPSVAEWTT